MTMQNMVDEFEKVGFNAERRYLGEGHYIFIIKKNNVVVDGKFEYRPSEAPGDRDVRQRAFISDLISAYYVTANDSEYVLNDVNTLKEIITQHHPKIKVVHFSGPVTTVIWDDGTKSQVRCQEGDTFDPEKGLALAIAKKALGNKGSWYDDIKKWVDKYRIRVGRKLISDMLGFDISEDSLVIDNFEFKLRPDGGATVKYVGPQDSDEAKRVDDNNKTASITKPLSNPHRCATCMYVNSPITHGPCSDCSWDYSNWKSADEPQVTHYNPIAEAYAIAVRIRDGLYDEDDTIESIIGFLGEALDN